MRLFHLFLIFLLILVWGLNFVVIKVGLDGFPPLFLACARFFLASIPAIFFFKRPEAPFLRVALYGFVIFVLQFSLFFMGMHFGVPPGLTSILLQAQVFFSFFLAVVFFHEKIRFWNIAGALISFSGIVYAGMNGSGNFSLIGFFLLIGGAAFWGAGSAISKSLGKVNTLSLVVWGSTIAWPFLLIFSLLFEGPEAIKKSFENLSWLPCGAVMYLAYLATLFGYGLWSWLLHHYPLSTVAPFTLMTPVVALFSSILLLGEPLELWKIEVAMLVLAGLSVNFLGHRLFAKKSPKVQDDSIIP